MNPAPGTILHIDFDSFFASVEQQYNPNLAGKPIGVTAANSRTCIIAASREAKKFGVKTGSNSWEAYKLCPELILTPANFVKYWEISKKFLNICSDYSPYVELFSLDEVFINMTHSLHLFGDVDSVIKTIKNRIKNEIGEVITVSVGISHNKLLAKLASGINKPNGVFEIKKQDIDRVYTNTKLTDICGIGERMATRLQKLGINNLLEVRNVPINILEAEFGKAYSQILKNIGIGKDDSPVIPYYIEQDVKSVGRNYCLPKNEYNKRVVMQNLYELCEEVGIKLRRLGKYARTVNVGLFGTCSIHGQKTYNQYFNSGREIFEIAKIIINEKHNNCSADKEYTRQIHVSASSLIDENNFQQTLFDFDNKENKVLSAVDEINEKFGDHTVRNGFLLYADKLTTVPNGYMADKWERKKLVI